MLENHLDWAPSLRLGHNDVKKTDGARGGNLLEKLTVQKNTKTVQKNMCAFKV